jgi:hypothetical protein
MQGTPNKNSRLLARFNMRTAHIPAKNNAHLTDQTSRSKEYTTCLEKLTRYMKGRQAAPSITKCKEQAMDKHIINKGHSISTVLARTACYMDCVVKEAVEIQLHPDNRHRIYSESILEPSYQHALTKQGQQATMAGRINNSQQTGMSRLSNTDCVITGMTDSLTLPTVSIGLLADRNTK